MDWLQCHKRINLNIQIAKSTYAKFIIKSSKKPIVVKKKQTT